MFIHLGCRPRIRWQQERFNSNLGLRGIEWAILSSMVKKAVYCLGILHYRWAWNLASMMDGTSSEAEPAALGYVFVPWFSTGTDRSRDFR